MKRILVLAAAIAVSSVFGVSAQATPVTLPTTLNKLDASGATTTVGNLEFSDFSYFSASSLTDSQIGVSSFKTGADAGIKFQGSFAAAPGVTNDYAISYTVTAISGTITDALLSATGNSVAGGGWTVNETLLNAANGDQIGTLTYVNGQLTSATLNFAGVSSIIVDKDISVTGGAPGTPNSSVSIIDQGFSTSAVPEPASMALLGIGLTGILAFRRRFKKASV